MIAKTYSDDEYYTTEEAAASFFELIVKPSGLLRNKTLLMPFTTTNTPLHEAAKKYHNNIVVFDGDMDLWTKAKLYDDVAVIDNPPFSLSAKVEQFYIDNDIPFVLFRSAVSYPKFIYATDGAGVIYENSKLGVMFQWGFARQIHGDKYIEENYPNLLDTLKHHRVLEKRVPVGFSFYLTDYDFKIKAVTFDEFVYPTKKDCYIYMTTGVFDEHTEVYIDKEDGRIHAISN